MSASIVEQTLARVATCLAAASMNVVRDRHRVLADEDLPCIVVRRGDVVEEDATVGDDAQSFNLSLDLEFITTGAAGTETQSDALHVDAHAVLMADPVLLALGKSTLRCVGSEVDTEAADAEFSRLIGHYQVSLWVAQGDLVTPQ